jgi:2-polyprenyl-6-methoxyphenol hydroxylase-like FAD-dependent oxidoreductase
VRRAFYPNEGPPKWNGVTMWRATTEAKPFLTGRSMLMAGTFARRVVVYPISKKHEDRGMSLINWVAELKIADDQPMPVQDWEFIADRDEVLKAFGAFEFDFLNVPEMIRNSSTIYQYPMVDRDALDTWVHGRVVLLGDAAHPMYPVGSNGASQAIIDARVLARELALKPSVDEALGAYDAVRRPATAAVVAANRKVGPELCMEIVEERAPDGFTRVEDIISVPELEEISARYKRTAGFDPNVLNARESLSVRRG